MRTTTWTSIRTTLFAAFAAFALAACGGDGSTDPGGGGGGGDGGGGDPVPTAVAIVSGNNQTARTGTALPQPLVVRVTDADGVGVEDVNVSWSVTSGPGSVLPNATSTDAQGRVSATFTAGADLGTSTVRATVPVISENVQFMVETTVALIRMQGTAFVAPGGGDDVTVPVGTTIQWENFDAVQHTATSSAEPAGGAVIDTGLMGNGDTRNFTPMVEGTWTYFCEVHPGIMVGATITATAASGSATR